MRRKAVSTLEPPQLPALLTPATLTADQLVAGAQFTALNLAEGVCAGVEAEDVVFDQVLGRGLRLGETHFSLAQLLDVRLDGCDLAGAAWEKAHLQRVEFVGCRMLGFALADGQADNLLVQKCNAESASFSSSSFRAARFEGCVLRRASFEGANLAGVVFRDCDLSGADLRGAKLNGADLRGCVLDGIQVSLAELRGVILEPAQLGLLAALAGVQVQELGG